MDPVASLAVAVLLLAGGAFAATWLAELFDQRTRPARQRVRPTPPPPNGLRTDRQPKD
jgi:hypothetical protein